MLIIKYSLSFFETDDFTHLYTLIVRPDLTYEVKIDNYVAEAGHLEEHWDFLPPPKIIDPDAQQPDYWDERETIEDPMDKKPDVRLSVSLLYALGIRNWVPFQLYLSTAVLFLMLVS